LILAEEHPAEGGHGMDWDKAGISSLREVLDVIKLETSKIMKAEKQRSHDLANGFFYTLKEEPEVKPTPGGEPHGNANYFFIKIDSTTLGVAPFCSHKEFWEKPTKVFLDKVTERGCKWGVVLFELPSKEGLWIEGPDFNDKVLKGREKVNSSDVRQARRDGIAQSFFKSSEFIELVKPYLIRKAR
jgi:hypothetical protein